jgi:hypothetical protein
MANQDSDSHLEEDISIHIFTASAAMVGVCLTVIGLLRVVITIRQINTLADDILAIDALVFLVSCLLSYWALRTRISRRMHRVERIADSVFILGLLLMVVVCGFIVYAVEISSGMPMNTAAPCMNRQTDTTLLPIGVVGREFLQSVLAGVVAAAGGLPDHFGLGSPVRS